MLLDGCIGKSRGGRRRDVRRIRKNEDPTFIVWELRQQLVLLLLLLRLLLLLLLLPLPLLLLLLLRLLLLLLLLLLLVAARVGWSEVCEIWNRRRAAGAGDGGSGRRRRTAATAAAAASTAACSWRQLLLQPAACVSCADSCATAHRLQRAIARRCRATCSVCRASMKKLVCIVCL